LPPQRVPKKHLVTKGKIAPGMLVQVNTKNGPQEAIVVKVGLKNIDVDTNHPLAGKTLTFDIEVVDIRDATTEEISHGHAHQPGGCGSH
jgi:FKBP-type peptidyl-prolyl cis-trans isomerase SlyD